MGRSKKQICKSGDICLIPLLDGSYLMGQVLEPQPDLLNSLSCALFDQRSDGRTWPGPDLDRLFSTLFTTPDLLDSGHWKVGATFPVHVPRDAFPGERAQKAGLNRRVIGSGIVIDFANAYCGLAPWDDWHNPSYLDGLLLSPDLKPQMLLFKS